MASESKLELADWALRASEFGALRQHARGRTLVAMEYMPTEPGRPSDWEGLRDQWLDLDPHPHVLLALGVGEGGSLLLRYAALEWQRPLAPVDTSEVARANVARWGTQIADAFVKIVAQVPEEELWRFLRPIVWIDLEGAARLTFLPVTDAANDVLPPEVRGSKARCDERSVVYAIGRALRARCSGLGGADAWVLARVFDRCCDPKPGNRYRVVEDLRIAWAGGPDAVRSGEDYAWWTRVEQAIGWFALDKPREWIELLDEVQGDTGELSFIAKALRAKAPRSGIGGVVSGVVQERRESQRAPRFTWDDASRRGRVLEQERSFGEALALYKRAIVDGTNDAAIYTAIARCQLALGDSGLAIDYAQRALAVDGKLVEAHAIRARGYEKRFQYEDALKGCRAWLTVAPADADAHYVRGRALLGLRRYVEAREAFDRTLALRPTMVEAMLLRREADRAAGVVREQVGEQPALVLDLPEHLAELREPLAKGNIAEIISILDEPRFASDALAKLVQARCLVFERRPGEAITAFDCVMQLAPEHERAASLGEAHALLVLHQGEDALALFDRVAAQHPGDLEALEGRALALRLLGRDADAEEAQGKLFAASASARAQ